MKLYSGKNVLLTGAAGIIGSKLSESLAREGANLFLIDIDEEKLEDLTQKIKSENNVSVKSYAVDITCETKLNQVLKQIEEESKSIDVLSE
jgi:short-subunit dehydrogenase